MIDIIFGNHLGRCTSQGDVLFNGVPRSPVLQRRMAYVSYEDTHIAVLTVRETLLYAAKLRMEYAIDNSVKENRVEEVMTMLGLEKVSFISKLIHL